MRRFRITSCFASFALLGTLIVPLAACTPNSSSPNADKPDADTTIWEDGPGSPEDPDISNADTSNMAEQHVSPYGLSGTVTMAAYMSERYSSFDHFDKGIQSGEEIPPSLRLFVSGSLDGYLHDTDTIRELWEDLCAVRIDVDHPLSESPDDSYISFSFDSGAEVIPFPFCTSAYAKFGDDAIFPVEDPDAVSALVERTSTLVEQEEKQAGDEVPFENGAYLWDADGDGVREHVWADYIDNGDEAPSVYSIRVFSETMDVEGYVDRAYGIEKMEAGKDERGPYLTMHFLEGDYYSHDREATCTLRVEDGKLVVE